MKKSVIIAVIAVAALAGMIYFRQLGKGDSPGPAGGSGQPAPSDAAGRAVVRPGYSLTLPENMREEPNGDFNFLYFPETDEPGAGPTDFLYVSVAPRGVGDAEGQIYNYRKNEVDILQATPVGETADLNKGGIPDLSSYYRYERTADRMLGGYGAAGFVNRKPWEFPAGTTEYRFIVPFTQGVYVIGYYSGQDDPHQTAFEEILSTLRLTPETIAVPSAPAGDGTRKTYRNMTWGLTFKYPSDWPVRDGGQSFPDGDLVAFQITGQTQRPQTELYDGMVFAVMTPVKTDEDINRWAEKTYGTTSDVNPENPPQYSDVTFGGKTYRKVYVCGLGCFSYYHTDNDGNVYGFMFLAAGPDEAVYEAQALELLGSVSFD